MGNPNLGRFLQMHGYSTCHHSLKAFLKKNAGLKQPTMIFPTAMNQMMQRKETQAYGSPLRELYWARFREASEDQIKQIFGAHGTVEDVVIFRPNSRTTASKGCGLVTMSSHAEAAAALNALNDAHIYGVDQPAVVVTWVDKNRGNAGTQSAAFRDTQLIAVAPPGCDADALKLYIGNLPLTSTEADLLPLLLPFGKIIELAVVRDKDDQLLASSGSGHKGCAFCWYQSKASAEAAMKALNLKHLLPDPTGRQPGPLIVRQARMVKPAAPIPGAPSVLSSGGGSGNFQMRIAEQLQHMQMMTDVPSIADYQQALSGTVLAAGVQAEPTSALVGWPAPNVDNARSMHAQRVQNAGLVGANNTMLSGSAQGSFVRLSAAGIVNSDVGGRASGAAYGMDASVPARLVRTVPHISHPPNTRLRAYVSNKSYDGDVLASLPDIASISLRQFADQQPSRVSNPAGFRSLDVDVVGGCMNPVQYEGSLVRPPAPLNMHNVTGRVHASSSGSMSLPRIGESSVATQQLGTQHVQRGRKLTASQLNMLMNSTGTDHQIGSLCSMLFSKDGVNAGGDVYGNATTSYIDSAQHGDAFLQAHLASADLLDSFLTGSEPTPRAMDSPSALLMQQLGMLSNTSYTPLDGHPSIPSCSAQPEQRVHTASPLMFMPPPPPTPTRRGVQQLAFGQAEYLDSPANLGQQLLQQQQCPPSRAQEGGLNIMQFKMDASKLPGAVSLLYDIEQATGSIISYFTESRSSCRLQVTGNHKAVQDAATLLVSLLECKD